MPRDFTQEEADRHNMLRDQARRLADGLLYLDGGPEQKRLGWLARRRLRRAIRCYEEALAINPEGWPSMWSVGKIHQRLGDHALALRWFSQAHEINPAQPDVAREASLSAMDCGESALALRYCEKAVLSAPDDAGLIANLALANMLCGNDEEAVRQAILAAKAAPNDKVSAFVLSFVTEVRDGKRQRPRRLHEALASEGV